MSEKTISIVTPSLNQGEFIEETIRSVLDQNYPKLEYVIVDGGSTDGTLEIIKKYEDRLHMWTSEKDMGHGHAINKGFAHTSGEIMAWINSDDKYTPWAFRTVSQIFTQLPHVSWIVGYHAWWNKEGAMTHAERGTKNIYDFLLGNYRSIQQESVFWRRSLWDKAGARVNQDYRYMIDGELWTRFFLHEDIYSVDCILGGYRLHGKNRGVKNRSACNEEMEKAISEMKEKCSKDVLNTYKALKLIRMTLSYRYFPILKVGRGVLFPSTFKNAAYNNIFYDDEGWKERTLRFSL